MAGILDADLDRGSLGRSARLAVLCDAVGGESGEQVNIICQCASVPVNMNFFCHEAVDADPRREAQ